MGIFSTFFERSESIVRGNQTQLKLAIAALISGRHILIEDVPGKGKTVLAKFLGRLFDLDFKRVQFTNDLMPSDLTGYYFFNQAKNEFIFRKGPLFGDIILIDEINRGSPRTQSALLQAMEEKNVSIENETHVLSDVFFVMATQNPREQIGTAPLPESQLDRFLFKFSMSELSIEEEINLLKSGSQHQSIEQMKPLFSKKDILSWKEQSKKIHVPATIIEWVSSFLQKSRHDAHVSPLGTRVGIDFIDGLKSYALINGRAEVFPEDVTFLFPYVFAHRLFAPKRFPIAQEYQEAMQWLNGKNQK